MVVAVMGITASQVTRLPTRSWVIWRVTHTPKRCLVCALQCFTTLSDRLSQKCRNWTDSASCRPQTVQRCPLNLHRCVRSPLYLTGQDFSTSHQLLSRLCVPPSHFQVIYERCSLQAAFPGNKTPPGYFLFFFPWEMQQNKHHWMKTNFHLLPLQCCE